MTDPSTSEATASRLRPETSTGTDTGSDTDIEGTVSVVLPPVLAALAGDRKLLQVPVRGAVTMADLLNTLGKDNPVLDRRIRDETGAVRRYVNMFVDGEDVRGLGGLSTEIRPGQELFIIQSVAGG